MATGEAMDHLRAALAYLDGLGLHPREVRAHSLGVTVVVPLADLAEHYEHSDIEVGRQNGHLVYYARPTAHLTVEAFGPARAPLDEVEWDRLGGAS